MIDRNLQNFRGADSTVSKDVLGIQMDRLTADEKFREAWTLFQHWQKPRPEAVVAIDSLPGSHYERRGESLFEFARLMMEAPSDRIDSQFRFDRLKALIPRILELPDGPDFFHKLVQSCADSVIDDKKGTWCQQE